MAGEAQGGWKLSCAPTVAWPSEMGERARAPDHLWLVAVVSGARADGAEAGELVQATRKGLELLLHACPTVSSTHGGSGVRPSAWRVTVNTAMTNAKPPRSRKHSTKWRRSFLTKRFICNSFLIRWVNHAQCRKEKIHTHRGRVSKSFVAQHPG